MCLRSTGYLAPNFARYHAVVAIERPVSMQVIQNKTNVVCKACVISAAPPQTQSSVVRRAFRRYMMCNNRNHTYVWHRDTMLTEKIVRAANQLKQAASRDVVIFQSGSRHDRILVGRLRSCVVCKVSDFEQTKHCTMHSDGSAVHHLRCHPTYLRCLRRRWW